MGVCWDHVIRTNRQTSLVAFKISGVGFWVQTWFRVERLRVEGLRKNTTNSNNHNSNNKSNNSNNSNSNNSN